MPRQILVIGRHRSGTSMVAGMLHHLGVPMGPQAPPEASAPPSNPLGQFEDDEFVQAFTRILGNWRNPREIFPTSELEILREIIARRDAEHPACWGLKAPRLCFATPFVLPMLSEPRAIIVTRPFEASVESLIARDKFPRPVAEHILSRYEIALYGSASVLNDAKIPHAILSYDYTLEEPEIAVEGICDMLPYEPTAAQREAAIRHVRPELNHAATGSVGA